MGDIVVRRRRDADDAFLLALGRAMFARYDRNAERTMVAMLGEPGAIVLVATEVPSLGESLGPTLEALRDASRDARRVGLAVVQVRRLGKPYGPWANPSRAHLNAIAVRPELHGRGVGGLLLGHAEAAACAAGAVSMALTTAETNHGARRLFERAGYVTLFAADAYDRGQTGLAMLKSLA